MDAGKRFSVDDLWQEGSPLPTLRTLKAIAQRCADAWDMPHLPREVTFGYNGRLRTTLGRAILADRHVELNIRLLMEHPEELVTTFVHELAHLAVSIRYGRVAPHGFEFRTLMHAVGLSPAATHDLPVAHLKQRRTRYLYLHRCSDCGYSFIVRSVRRNIYCSACGPDMTWDIFRAPQSDKGLAQLRRFQRAQTQGA